MLRGEGTEKPVMDHHSIQGGVGGVATACQVQTFWKIETKQNSQVFTYIVQLLVWTSDLRLNNLDVF